MFTSLLLVALAAAPRPFTVDDLLALERAGDPAISPDGALVAYTVARAAPGGEKLVSAVWVVPARGPAAAARRLTFGDETVAAPAFSPDGRRIAFLSNRRGSARQVFVLDLAGGEAAQATDLPGGVSELLWSADGKALLVTSDVDPACGADAACNRRATEAASKAPHAATRLLFRHWNEWRDRVRSHLLVVPLDGGAVRDLTPGDHDVPPSDRGGRRDLALSPDGQLVYFVKVSDPVEAISTNGDVYAVPVAGGEARRITTGEGWDGVPRPSPDGKRIAWLSMARAGYEADRLRVMVADADGKNARDLTATVDVSAQELWWARGGKVLRFTALVGPRHQVFEVDAAGGSVRPISRLSVNLNALAVARDGELAAATVDTLTAPPEIALVAPAPRNDRALAATTLTALGARALEGIALGSVRPLEATGKDGATIHGLVVLPPGHRDGERHPAVVLVHGGPQGAWIDGWSFRWNPLLYAARGWTVVLPNPRGSTGYGQAYEDAVRNDWGGLPYDDVMRLTDAAVAAGLADGARMCAAGASYGGYMVNWINGQTDRFRCLVTHAGDFDTHAAYYDTEELWFPEWEMGGPAYENAEAYDRWSPRRFVSRWKTPTLVTHGELDFRVTVTQGLSTFTALQRRGIPSKLLVFPDEGHWISKPRNAKVFHEEVLGWIERFLAAGPAQAAAAP
ncbi:dipeptidyl-peptidase 5 [Anaeromyxobacter oryzae]|uniref:Prolyl oligopeptidase n=1 Tax=Anaeromyxobacter oryzae TaxID=2918170 RepID=A0ABM7WVV7_9BACT|nr:S9 family peptidase [Anaeromyxobacter oryzae]BDG03642.1 prolyl oligopeptidase [Anaeromyxobacter oryzae]